EPSPPQPAPPSHHTGTGSPSYPQAAAGSTRSPTPHELPHAKPMRATPARSLTSTRIAAAPPTTPPAHPPPPQPSKASPGDSNPSPDKCHSQSNPPPTHTSRTNPSTPSHPAHTRPR